MKKDMSVMLVERSVKLMTVTAPQLEGPDKTYRFTSEDATVTFEGFQYVPLSLFDQQRYAELAKEKTC